MRAIATQIIEALNNAKTWLTQVRADAQQLVKMDAVQLSQPSTLALLDNMLLNATYAYIGKLRSKDRPGRSWCSTGSLRCSAACDIDYYAQAAAKYLRML